ALAKRQGVSPSYFTRLVRLSYLAPDITEAILDGRQPRDLTADKLLAHSRLPLGWHEQPTVLGFAWARPNSAPVTSLTDLAGTSATKVANRLTRHCGTGIGPDRDNTGSWRNVHEHCASLPTVPPEGPAHAAATAGFSITDGEIPRETDCLLEGTGFELVWGFWCQVIVCGWPVLCSERESRSSSCRLRSGSRSARKGSRDRNGSNAWRRAA